MPYPFEHLRSDAQQAKLFREKLPQVNAAMPEFFRTMAIAQRSIAQKNMFGHPQGVRQDLGFETALRLVLIACLNERLFRINEDTKTVVNTLRLLVLKWYAFGNALDACLYFGHYFYAYQNHSQYAVKLLMEQSRFVAPHADKVAPNQVGLSLIATLPEPRWYKSVEGLGDKLSSIFIATADMANVDAQISGLQIHFKQTNQFDLRAPLFVRADAIETAQVLNDKVIVRCPHCSQKCRGNYFRYIDITCPKCQGHWSQRM